MYYALLKTVSTCGGLPRLWRNQLSIPLRILCYEKNHFPSSEVIVIHPLETRLASALASAGLHGLLFFTITLMITTRPHHGGGEMQLNFTQRTLSQPEELIKPLPLPAPVPLKGDNGEGSRDTASAQKVKGALRTAMESPDTSALRQIYQESTLQVSVRFPLAWSFIDQPKDNRLSGVTFIGAAGEGRVPPFIHIEVADPELFLKDRYLYSEELEDCYLYYNDPTEMEGQFEQVVYMQTGERFDFLFRLSVRDTEDFEAHRKVFYDMLGTFTYGK